MKSKNLKAVVDYASVTFRTIGIAGCTTGFLAVLFRRTEAIEQPMAVIVTLVLGTAFVFVGAYLAYLSEEIVIEDDEEELKE